LFFLNQTVFRLLQQKNWKTVRVLDRYGKL
jgi:hypothetical protein